MLTTMIFFNPAYGRHLLYQNTFPPKNIYILFFFLCVRCHELYVAELKVSRVLWLGPKLYVKVFADHEYLLVYCTMYVIIIRPGVAGAVLKTGIEYFFAKFCLIKNTLAFVPINIY